MKYKIKNVLISGSLVYDRIMNFPGYFKEHIMPEKIHILNVAFSVNGLKESYGGTAGNIAYNLALLRERSTILSCVGADFSPYKKRLSKNRVDVSQIKIIKNKNTASCYIMTDKSDNQITAFNPEALISPRGIFKVEEPKESLGIISPGNGKDMEDYARFYKKRSVKYIFDPGQQITSLSANVLKNSITGAHILIGNDYEISLISKKTGWDLPRLIDKAETVIITKGENGSEIYSENEKISVKAVKLKKIIDPTGAGDAYRAGLIKGLINGWPLKKTAQFASVVASYAVEKQGTQEHKFGWNHIRERYYKSYKETI